MTERQRRAATLAATLCLVFGLAGGLGAQTLSLHLSEGPGLSGGDFALSFASALMDAYFDSGFIMTSERPSALELEAWRAERPDLAAARLGFVDYLAELHLEWRATNGERPLLALLEHRLIRVDDGSTILASTSESSVLRPGEDQGRQLRRLAEEIAKQHIATIARLSGGKK